MNAGTIWCRRCCIFQNIIGPEYQASAGTLAWISGGAINRLHQVAEFAVDLVYPKRCAGCARRGTWLCPDCNMTLSLFNIPWCERCGVPGTYFRCKCSSTPQNLNQVRSVGPFDGWLRGAVVQFKYHGEWARAAHLGEPLAAVISHLQHADTLVPVPLHTARLRQRGFNQSLLLAQHAASLLDIDVREALIRTRRTDAQINLGSEQRKLNVDGAFAVPAAFPVAGLSIVLIDDVITTGSTLSACAATLISAGATSVTAATLAREM